MCIIDRKTYLHTDGRVETVETTTRCKRASGRGLCKNVTYKEPTRVQPVGRRPSIDRNPSSGVLITEGKDGRRHVYRDISNRSSGSSSVRRSYTMSERSSVSSASSPASPEPKKGGPIPPLSTETMWPPLEQSRAPYPPFPPPSPNMIITPDGTAQYARPPSIYMERASDNERPSTSAGERTLPRSSSWSSTKAEVDDPEESRPKQKRRPSIKVKTDIRQPGSTPPPIIESPGLSNLPRIGHGRKDSAKDVPKGDAVKHVRYRSDSDRDRPSEHKDPRRKDDASRLIDKDDRLKRDTDTRRRKDKTKAKGRISQEEADRQRRREEEADRRRQEEDYQAQLERSRLAESDRRQSAREELAREAARRRDAESIPREASRERNRQAALADLERRADDAVEEDDPVQAFVDFEEEQMARERAAAARRRESYSSYGSLGSADVPPYVNDQLRRDADARARYEAQRPANRARGWSYNTYSTSPNTTRSPLSPLSARPAPVLHQYPSANQAPPARYSGTISQRGADVLAREQARGSRELNDSFGSLHVNVDQEPVYEEVEPSSSDYYYWQGYGKKRL